MPCNPLVLSLMVWTAISCDLSLPEVDLSAPDAAVNLVEAFENYGFSYIRGHKVKENIIKRAEEQAKLFFKLPKR